MVDGLQNKKVVFIIQARMQSTRLPGKILLPLPIDSDYSIIDRIISSLKQSNTNKRIYIATSKNKENDLLEQVALENEVQIYRGSEDDVLSRFIGILENESFDVVIRITADNPIIDVSLLDLVIKEHVSQKVDYTNTVGLPLGMNFEIIDAKALISLKGKSLSPEDKEHVTLYIKNSKEYKCFTTKVNISEKYQNVRVTVDYPSDYLVVSALFSLHEKNEIPFGLTTIGYAMDYFPFLFEINQQNVQKVNYTTLEEEVKAALPVLETLEFKKIVTLLRTNQKE